MRMSLGAAAILLCSTSLALAAPAGHGARANRVSAGGATLNAAASNPAGRTTPVGQTAAEIAASRRQDLISHDEAIAAAVQEQKVDAHTHFLAERKAKCDARHQHTVQSTPPAPPVQTVVTATPPTITTATPAKPSEITGKTSAQVSPVAPLDPSELTDIACGRRPDATIICHFRPGAIGFSVRTAG